MENVRDSSNLKTINKKCHIYHNHIRCENNEKIYVSSITHDDGTMYSKHNLELSKHFSWKEKYDIYMNNSLKLKKNEFIDVNQDFLPLSGFIKASRCIKKIVHIDDVVFYFPYPTWPFGHYSIYGYQYFYYYSYLKKKHPHIKIIMNDPLQSFLNYGTSNNKYWFFLKDTLDLKNIIYTNSQTVFVNSGTTYTIYSQMEEPIRFSDECIQYFNNLAELSLLKNKVDVGLKPYPKKLLFLRKSENISSNSKRLLKNREQIVELCKKYGYIDIDQTLYSMEEIMYLMNNATHIITESGGSLCHLLWTKSIKTICIVWGYDAVLLLPNFYKNSNKYFKMIPPGSGNVFERLLMYHNARVVYNKQAQELIDILEGKQHYFIEDNILSECFFNIEEFEHAIQDHE